MSDIWYIIGGIAAILFIVGIVIFIDILDSRIDKLEKELAELKNKLSSPIIIPAEDRNNEIY